MVQKPESVNLMTDSFPCLRFVSNGQRYNCCHFITAAVFVSMNLVFGLFVCENFTIKILVDFSK